MSRKGNGIFLIVTIAFIAFLLGIFITTFKTEDIPPQALNPAGGEERAMPAPQTELVNAVRKLRQENADLSARNRELSRAADERAAAVAAGEDSEDTAVMALKEKIQGISFAFDSIDTRPGKESQLTSLLRSMYKELTAIEFSMAKIAHDQPFYRERLREKEKMLTERKKELSGLKDELCRTEQEIARQKSTAEKYMGYKTKFDDLTRQYDSLTKKAVSDETRLQKVEAALKDMEQERESIAAAERAANEKVEKYGAEISRLSGEREEVNRRLQEALAKSRLLQDDVYGLQEKNKVLLSEKEEMKTELARYSTAVKKLEQDLVRSGEETARYRGYKDRYDNLNALYKELSAGAARDKQALDRLGAVVGSLEQEKAAFVRAESANRDKLKEYSVSIEQLAREKAGIASRIAEIEEENKRLIAKIGDAQEETAGYARRRDDLEKKIAEYEGMVGTLEKKAEDQDKLIAEFRGYKDRFEELRGEYDTLVEKAAENDAALNALNKRLEAMAGEKMKYAEAEKKAQELLVNNEQTIRQLVTEKENLLEHLNRYAHEASILSEELKAVGSEKEEYARAKAAMEKEIERYLGDIRDLGREIGRLKSEYAQVMDENGELSGSVVQLKKDNTSIEKDRRTLEKELSRLSRKMQEKEKEVATLKEGLARSRTEYENMNKQYIIMTRKIDSITLDLARRAEKIVSLQENLEKKDASLETVKRDLENQYKEMALLRENMVKVRMENSRMMEEIEERETALACLKQEIRRISDINSQFKSSIERVSSVIEEDESYAETGKGVSVVSADEKDSQVKVEIDSVLPARAGQ